MCVCSQHLQVWKIGLLNLRQNIEIIFHLMRRADSLEKTLTLGGIGGRRRRRRQRMRWLDGITDSMDMSWVNSRSWWWTGRPGVLQFMGSQRVRHDWATELNWTDSKPEYNMQMWVTDNNQLKLNRWYFWARTKLSLTQNEFYFVLNL